MADIAAAPPPPVDYTKQIADLEGQQSAEQTRLQTERDTAMQPVEAERKALAGDLQSMLAKGPEQAKLPDNTAQHIDPKTLNDTASMMMTWAGLAGLLTRRPMTAALNNMTAAMQGLQAGDQEQYDRSYKEFQDNYKKAADLSKEKLAEYDRIFKAKDMSLSEKDRELTSIAKRYGDQIAANTKSFGDKIKHIEGERTASEKTQEHFDNLNRWNEDRKARLEMHSEDVKQREIAHNDMMELRREAAAARNAKSSATGDAVQRRMVNAGNQVAHALESIVDLPITTTGGLFGGPKKESGLFGATKQALANEMNAKEAQEYEIMIAGVQRSLATIEASGVATGLVGLSQKMDAIKFQPGQPEMVRLRALAEIRQITEAGLEGAMRDPKTTPENKELLQNVIDSVKASVPFTHKDITTLERMQQTDPEKTLLDVMRENKKQVGSGSGKTVKRTGTHDGRKVVEYTDGTIEYAD